MSGATINYPSPASATNEPESRRLRLWLRVACRYLLAAVFLMAAVTKIIDLRGFEDQVLLHSDLPRWLGKATLIVPGTKPIAGLHLAKLIVAFLPWLELTCGLCLVFAWAVREAALTTAFLLVLFVISSIASQTEDCHCFFVPSALSNLPWWSHSLRDAGLLLCSLLVAFMPSKSKPTMPGPTHRQQ